MKSYLVANNLGVGTFDDQDALIVVLLYHIRLSKLLSFSTALFGEFCDCYPGACAFARIQVLLFP